MVYDALLHRIKMAILLNTNEVFVIDLKTLAAQLVWL